MSDIKYKEFALLAGEEDGHLKIRALGEESGWKLMWAVLKFDGTLATTPRSPSALFLVKEEAKSYMTYLQKICKIKDIWLDQVMTNGHLIKIPVKGDLTLPADQEKAKIALMVLKCALKTLGEAPYTGGCCTFYTPDEWKARKEEHCLNAELIIVHDGGDFSNMCNYNKCEYTLLEKFANELKKKGYYTESAYGWYSGLYKIEDEKNE
jgi:hypothetical protein